MVSLSMCHVLRPVLNMKFFIYLKNSPSQSSQKPFESFKYWTNMDSELVHYSDHEYTLACQAREEGNFSHIYQKQISVKGLNFRYILQSSLL